MARRVQMQLFNSTTETLNDYADLTQVASLGGTSIGTAAANLVVLTGVLSTDYVIVNNNMATIQRAVNGILTALT